MDKLSDQLPTDVYSSLTDNFYISDLEEDKQKSVYGVYLTDTKLFKENANNEDPYVLGIIANSKHKANTVEFIRFLFNE
jgi:ABC-type molybdate transport system substrate-binding protein